MYLFPLKKQRISLNFKIPPLPAIIVYMNINSLLPEEIKQILEKNNIKGYRANQIFNWLHKQLVTDFFLMTNISKEERVKLSQIFEIVVPEIKKVQKASDGTKKYLVDFEGQGSSAKGQVETVLIKNTSKRKTVCVSTQVGCPLSCKFCATGRMGFKRNLSADEIIAQIELVYKQNHGIENVVFMGMGEPLLNLDNVLKAIDIINHQKGLNIGARKITISTAGIPQKIEKLIEYPKQVRLAVSLNSAIQKKRKDIMPIAKKYPLHQLIPAIKEYIDQTGRRVTFEYILIKDFNDLDEDVGALWELCRGLNVNVNLIPLNPAPKSRYEPSSKKIQEWFQQQLQGNDINTLYRKSRGGQINAACGQLAGND